MSTRGRRGIALPMVLLVLVALGFLSSLAVGDALQSARVASLAEDELAARAAVLDGLAHARTPPDLPWLCLQPPAVAMRQVHPRASGGALEITWWQVRPGVVRVQLVGVGASGARHRRLGWLRPDSVVPDDPRPGCPEATRLVPAASDWLTAHPAG